MKLNRVSGILSVAVLAGLWGCSSQKQVAQQYVYDDLYANSTDVRAVAYSSKRSGTVERAQPGDESVVTRGQAQSAGTDEYYSPELSAGNYKRGQPGYSNNDYDAGYADGFNNAQRNAGWNNVGWNRWNSWNNWGWGGGFGGWGWNNWMSPGISIGLGWGRPWGWGGGFYDPFWGWGGGWGWNNWAYSPWGFNDWGWGGWGWGRNRVWINNNYYYGNGGTGSGGGVVTNPGTNYSRPRTRADYDRYQAAYNEDAYRSTATRNGQRSAADGNSYYSRPRQDYNSWNDRNASYGNGSGSYSRGSYSQPSQSSGNTYQNRSQGWDNSWSRGSSGFENRSSGSSFGGSSGGSYGGGGGGGGRSRGPR